MTTKAVLAEIHKEAKKRTPSQRERILMLLRNAGTEGVTNLILLDLCGHFQARMSELYAQGYEIDVIPIDNERGINKYVLVREPEVIAKQEKAIDILKKAIVEREYGIDIDDLEDALNLLGLQVTRKVGFNLTRKSK